MQNPNQLIEQAKTTRAWQRLVRAQGAPAQPTLTSVQQTPAGHDPLQSELLAELNSPPKHRLYSEIMKKHDAVHPRR